MKQENIISNIVLGVCTILLVIVVLSNVYAFFPALTNSLGTLSDWFMVLITAITAVFLYRTLDSQMKVQKDQNRIFKIEEKKYIRAIKPNILFNTSSNKKNWEKPLDNSHKNKLLSFKQTFNLNIDKDCFLTYKLSTKSKVYIDKKINFVEQNNNPIHISITVNVVDYNVKGIPIFENFYLEINYTDKDKNEYKLIKELGIDYEAMNNRIIWIEFYSSDEMIKTVY